MTVTSASGLRSTQKYATKNPTTQQIVPTDLVSQRMLIRRRTSARQSRADLGGSEALMKIWTEASIRKTRNA